MRRLEAVRLIQWYHFQDQTFPIGASCLLVGDNGSGKTTVLDAIQIALVADLGEVLFNRAANEKSRRTIHGYEVDDVSRGFIEQRGFGPYFLHRTGHSIGYEVHGNGVNIDNLETRDQRRIVPGVCFSIEPGIYLPEFGVRSEIDMIIRNGKAEVSGKIQNELVLI